MSKSLLSITALALAGLISVPKAAYPCGNAVYLDKDEAARLVAKAERAIEAGNFKRALSLLEYGDVEVDSRPLEKRIQLLAATANLRLHNVTSAVWSFDSLNQEHPDDPVIQTRLGESLSHLPRAVSKKKGLEILERLDAKDLMADEWGYVALARLRANGGDDAGAERALTRCKAMAKNPSVCAISSPTKKSKTKPGKDKASAKPVG